MTTTRPAPPGSQPPAVAVIRFDPNEPNFDLYHAVMTSTSAALRPAPLFQVHQ